MTSLNDAYWPDAELASVTVSYDVVEIALTCVDGRRRTIRCDGQIALSLGPCWDETVVRQCKLSSDSVLQQSTLAALASSPAYRTGSGSPARDKRTFRTLTITFMDDSELLVVAHGFSAEERV